MNTKIKISVNTDLNEIIKRINGSMEAAMLNEETLMMDTAIYEKNNLPSLLDQIGATVKNSQNRDMALLTTLTILSCMLRHYDVEHRNKIEGCQLSNYILGNAATGKGYVNTWRQIGMGYHRSLDKIYRDELEIYKSTLQEASGNPEKLERLIKPIRKTLFLATNTNKPTLAKELFDNDGIGLLFSTEADTLITSNKGEHGNFSDLMRAAFHGEPHSINRKSMEDGPIEIEKVRFGMLLTSTLNQLLGFITNYEDGLFTRFIYYIVSPNAGYEYERDGDNATELNQLIDSISKRFEKIGKFDSELTYSIRFQFTDDQKDQRDAFLKSVDDDFNTQYDGRLHGNITRYSLTFTRMCMLLSYLRYFDEEKPHNVKTITCNDVDFNTTILIVGKLIHHLQIIDYSYATKNKGKHGMLFFSSEAKQHDLKKEDSLELRREALNLRYQGYSFRQIAEKVLGNRNLQGTAYKMIVKAGKMEEAFPFPETETGHEKNNYVAVKDLLERTRVSVFKSVQTANPNLNPLDLFTLLATPKYKSITDAARRLTNPIVQKKFKTRIPAFTPSGRFRIRRSNDTLVRHSGFICIDIDFKGNETISNFDELQLELSNILNVAFCGRSISGNGYYLLIPIKDVDKHGMYFDALKDAFKELGIEIDKGCGDVSRMRIVAYNEDHFMADTAKILFTTLDNTKELVEIKTTLLKTIDNSTQTKKSIEALLTKIEEKGIDITDQYHDWVTICFAIVNTFGKDGLDYFIRISQHYPNFDLKENKELFASCIKTVKTDDQHAGLASIYRIAKKYGL